MLKYSQQKDKIMKKYVFEEIEITRIEDRHCVRFTPIIDATFWTGIYAPTTFRGFLKLLSKTKVNYEGHYNIIRSNSPFPGTHPVAFDDLLQEFVGIVYDRRVPDATKISEFYKNAYAIREEARKGRRILNTPPEEMIK